MEARIAAAGLVDMRKFWNFQLTQLRFSLSFVHNTSGFANEKLEKRTFDGSPIIIVSKRSSRQLEQTFGCGIAMC